MHIKIYIVEYLAQNCFFLAIVECNWILFGSLYIIKVSKLCWIFFLKKRLFHFDDIIIEFTLYVVTNEYSLDVLLLNGPDIITRLLIVIDSTLFQFRIKVHKILSFHFTQFKQKNVCAEKKKILSLACRRSFYAIQKSCQVRMRNNERQHVINDRSFVCAGYWRRHPVITQHAFFMERGKDFVAIPFTNIYSTLFFSPNNNINKTYCYIFIEGSI
jgi:hypothetical protein